ncbi:MAG TPA: hypothetical protein VMT03_08640 [Polyangia bacterium]|nr:hypothetical protein [Polyangia bacterium]
MDEETLFRIAGREDLLRRYHREVVVKKSLMIGGGAAMAGGLLYAFIADFTGPSQNVSACPNNGCKSYPSPSGGLNPAWGLAAAGAGLVSLVVGHYLDPSPISAGEADRLAREYDPGAR